MPPRNVVPKPRQKPHPPVWVACSRRDTIHLAAQKGIGALAFAFVDPEEARHWVDDYYETLAHEGVPIGDAVNANVACVTTVHVPRGRGRRARAAGSRARTSSATRSRTTTCSVATSPARTDVWAEYQQRRAEHGYDPEAVARRRRERGPARRQGRARTGSAACAARSARPTRCASTCGATRSAASTR